MGMLGFSGETYYFGASKSVRLIESADKNFLARAVQKAILQGRDITQSILHNVTVNYGADVQKFINYSASKNPFWINTTGIYHQIELDVRNELVTFPYQGRPEVVEVTDFRIESEENTSSQVRDWYVLSQLELWYGLGFNREAPGENITGNSSDAVARYTGYSTGARYYETRTANFYPEYDYEQSMYPFTVEFQVMNTQGQWRAYTKTYQWMYSPEKRVVQCKYRRAGTEFFENTYIGSMSDAVAWSGFDVVGGFNNLGAWKPEKRTEDERLAGRYFVDPVPIVIMGEKASGNYGAIPGVPESFSLDATYQALGYLNLDFDELYDSVMDVNNQDSLELLSAEVEFSLFVRNQTQPVLKALWLTFIEAYKYAYISYEKFIAVKAAGESNDLGFFPGNKLGAAIYYNYVKYERNLSGTAGAVGTYRSSVNIVEETFEILRTTGFENNVTFEFDNSDLIIEYQTSVDKFDRLTINGLQRTTEYRPTGGNRNPQRIIKNLNSTTALDASTVSGFEDEGLRIPLHTHIWNKLSAVEKEEVAYSAVALNMQVEKQEYLEWYKTAGFLDVVQIVLVAVTIITAGQSAWFEALLAAGSLQAAALIILEVIFYAVAINAAFDLAINVLGEDFALLAAVVAIAAAVYTGNVEIAINIGESSFATNLLQLATLAIEAVNRSVADDMADLMREQEEWEEENNERQQQLMDIDAITDVSTGINLMDTFYGGFYFNEKETPEMFVKRSLLTNIATPALSFPSTYVKDALNLDNITNEGY